MKRVILILTLLITLSLACSLSGLTGGGDDTAPINEPPPTRSADSQLSEKRCGDGVCDGPENVNNCPEDCDTGEAAKPSEEGATETKKESAQGDRAASEYGILYHIIKHSVTSNEMSGTKCYLFSFREFLDGGYIQPDGSGNEILDLKDNPTSIVASKKDDNFYYISSPVNPVTENYGISMFDWDVEDQTLWSSDFANNNPVEITKSDQGKFPGGVTTSPKNRYLLYLMTQESKANGGQSGGLMPGNLNPFLYDSSLIVENINNSGKRPVLPGNYNRQLFTSFADFSTDGDLFYTIAREGESFKFVKVSLDSGAVTDFADVFPGFDWGSLNWDQFFPPSDDFSYASFTISPDETRLIAYKNIFTSNLDNPCFSEAKHTLWAFNLETNKLDRFENQQGYVSDADWKYDSTEFALTVIGNSGCYPDYLDSKIEILDKDGKNSSTLVNESKSKITNLGWSPDGSVIVYDVYSTDFVGRLKLVDVETKQVDEVINTQTLGYEVNQSNPVTLLFADWVFTK
ncbi:MAG: hypothetical protein U9Q82_02395 [Chloroflexota bacterium]|nr:hypothetical protein [Chloroflexota bacterium]